MNDLNRRVLAAFIACCIALLFLRTTCAGQEPQLTDFIDPAQFLVDKETDLIAIIKIRHAENRWVILPDGDHFPLIISECEMEQTLSGSTVWPKLLTQTVVQFDYSDMIDGPIAPPVIADRRYLLFASVTPEDGEVPPVAPWTAHPQGFLLVRRQKSGEFVYWNGKSYAIEAIKKEVAGGRRLPLDKIVDPVRRVRIAEARVREGIHGDENAFIRGLLVIIQDPDGQARQVEPVARSASSRDEFSMSEYESRPHALWYESLALLRDFGDDEVVRNDVVEALTPIAQNARPKIRLAAALALVDLESDAGREALISGFENESGPVSSDPPDAMTFPGRYPYDGSSITACAHALARMGDLRGLRHKDPDVRLAAAEAVMEQPGTPELMKMLAVLAIELEPQVEKLRASGELAKPRRRGDYTSRYPLNWVRTQRLLARQGDEEAYRRLVEAYLVDVSTYPKEEAPLVPKGQVVSWSQGPSLAEAIFSADTGPSQALERLRKNYGRDPRWSGITFQTMVTWFDKSSPTGAEEGGRKKPSEADIAVLLGDSNADRRADGLAAAGYYQVEAFYDKVLDKALNGQGVERRAAIYGLGFYGHDIPETVLRQLMKAEDSNVRLSVMELATRKNAARFADEALEFAHGVLNARAASPQDWNTQRDVEYLPRILCRLARGPIPQRMIDGLKNPDPTFRRILIEALELSGNLDAVTFLRPLTADSDPTVRETSEAALRVLGPVDVE